VKTLHSIGEVVFNKDGKAKQLVGIVQDVTEQNKLTEKLQQSEALYKQSEALAHLGSWQQHLQKGKVFWSEELYRILGIPVLPEPIPFEEFTDFIHPDDQKLYKEKFHKAIHAQQPFQLEYRILNKEGGFKTLLVHTEVQLDAEGKTSGLFGFVQDITEKKEAETRLRESQNFIQKITNTAPTIIAMFHARTGKHLFVNEGIKKLLGYEPEEALQGGIDFISGLIHPDDAAENRKGLNNALKQVNKAAEHDGKGDIVFENTYRIRHKNGEWRWFTTYTAIFDKNAEGAAEHLLNISLDVTAQKEAEKNVVEQQEFIQHIADASPTILYLYDVGKNCIAYVNREIFFVLGYMPEEILAMDSKVT
jgi:PAS domain S-box-containing protein